MVRLIIEILIVMIVSSFAFVLGAIFGASRIRRDEEEERIEEFMKEAEKTKDEEQLA